MLIAQVDPTAAVAGGLSNGNATALAWALAIALGVVGYLYKQLSDLRSEHAKELAALHKAELDQVRADAKEQREILQQVVPLAEKMVEVTERLTDRLDHEGA